LWGVVLGLVMPGVLHKVIVGQLAQLTGRPVSVERVEIEPYALVVRLLDLRIGAQQAPGSEPPPASRLNLARVEADLSWRSLRHLAPVVERLRVEQPALLVVRDAEGNYDGQDIIERMQAPAPDDDA